MIPLLPCPHCASTDVGYFNFRTHPVPDGLISDNTMVHCRGCKAVSAIASSVTPEGVRNFECQCKPARMEIAAASWNHRE